MAELVLNAGDAGRTLAIPETQVLVEMDDSDSEEVTIAQLIAFGRLPKVNGGEPFLVGHLKRHRNHRSDLAALALGRVGEPSALGPIVSKLSSRTPLRKAAYLIAAGELVGRFPDADGADRALSLLSQQASGEGRRRTEQARLSAMAALWGLAATASAGGRTVLLDRAVDLDNGILRVMAIRLAAAREPPRLKPGLWDFELDWQRKRRFGKDLLRRLLLPWLAQDETSLALALGRVEVPLLQRLRAAHGDRSHDGGRQVWCRTLASALSGAPSIANWCR